MLMYRPSRRPTGDKTICRVGMAKYPVTVVASKNGRDSIIILVKDTQTVVEIYLCETGVFDSTIDVIE